MSSRALRDPNEPTGALNHDGSRSLQSSRKPLRRGQRGQSRPRLPDASDIWECSVFEVVVVIDRRGGARTLRCRRTLQELRGMAFAARLARFAGGALGRIATDLRLQLDDVE